MDLAPLSIAISTNIININKSNKKTFTFLFVLFIKTNINILKANIQTFEKIWLINYSSNSFSFSLVVYTYVISGLV